MSNKIIERVYQYLRYKDISAYEFERKNSISNGYLGKQAARKGGIGEDVLVKILENCHEISPDWLMLGEGEMLRNSEIGASESRSCDACPKIIALQEKIINLQSKIIEGCTTAPIVPARKVRRTDAVSTAMAVLGGGVAASTDKETSSLPSPAAALTPAD